MLALGPLMSALGNSVSAFSSAANTASKGGDLMGMLQGKKTADASPIKKPESIYDILQRMAPAQSGSPLDNNQYFDAAMMKAANKRSSPQDMSAMAQMGMNSNSQAIPAQQMQPPAFLQQLMQGQKGGPDMEYIRAMQANNNPLLKLLGG